MSRHILIGFGYVASYLAEVLIENKQEVMSISRQTPHHLPDNINHVSLDIRQAPIDIREKDILYYFIPPLHENEQDFIMMDFLNQLTQQPKKIIYIGSSGIYGQHHGEWVDEISPCHIETIRQKQRASSESQLKSYSEKYQVPCALLRVAGIYGPHRLPMDAVYAQTPVIIKEEAPFINHIYVKDLAQILAYLGTQVTYHGNLNIADGQPSPMGTLQQMLAQKLQYPLAPFVSYRDVWNSASEMKKEFMSQNKKLNIQRLLQILNSSDISITPMQDAIQEILSS